MSKKQKKPLPMILDESGVLIVKCCASCLYKKHNTAFTRLCMKGKGIVNPEDPPCDKYAQQAFFKDKLAIGLGEVKRKAYLMYFLDNYGKVYREVAAEGLPDSVETIRRLRERFEQTTGQSIYIKF